VAWGGVSNDPVQQRLAEAFLDKHQVGSGLRPVQLPASPDVEAFGREFAPPPLHRFRLFRAAGVTGVDADGDDTAGKEEPGGMVERHQGVLRLGNDPFVPPGEVAEVEDCSPERLMDKLPETLVP